MNIYARGIVVLGLSFWGSLSAWAETGDAHAVGLATGLCADPTSFKGAAMTPKALPQAYDRIYVPFMYPNLGTPTRGKIPTDQGYHQILKGFDDLAAGPFFARCLQTFYFACEFYGHTKLGLDYALDMGQKVDSRIVGQWWVKTPSAQGYSTWISDLTTERRPISGFFKDLECFPGPTWEDGPFPDPNYVAPIPEPDARKYLPKLPQFDPMKQPVPVFSPAAPAYEPGDILAEHLRRTLTTAMVLDLIEMTPKNQPGATGGYVLGLTAAGALTVAALSKAGVLSTSALSAAASGAGSVAGLTVLGVIGAAFISLSATYPHQDIRDEPWRFADLPLAQQLNIRDRHKDVYALVQTFQQDVDAMIAKHLERQRDPDCAPATKASQVTVCPGDGAPYQVWVKDE